MTWPGHSASRAWHAAKLSSFMQASRGLWAAQVSLPLSVGERVVEPQAIIASASVASIASFMGETIAALNRRR